MDTLVAFGAVSAPAASKPTTTCTRGPSKGRTGKKPATKREAAAVVRKALFGYDASLIIARDPRHDGAPLPNASANPDVIPALFLAMSIEKPSVTPGLVALEALCRVDPRFPRAKLAGDRACNDQKPENFQLPIRALGYDPVYDYAKDNLGLQGGVEGAILVEGTWYCPSMPKPLISATADLIAEIIDKETWVKRIAARTAYRLMPKELPDAEGHQRMMCPAEAGRAQCPLKPHTMGRGIHLPLVDPEPIPTGVRKICRQRSITVPPESGANLWQPLEYGGIDWQRVYFRLRNSIEGGNGHAKDLLNEDIESAGTRRIRGIAAQGILLAFQLAHANLRKLANWAAAVALNDERPHQRPSRHRQTKDLGSWTPPDTSTNPHRHRKRPRPDAPRRG
ncbi:MULTISPECIES: hypothetical protein [Streptacidiphilus]|uniref:Transposase DDE domain-containing protein n=1 Tax=Streptacidiphilus cavernicola TaxID=3342716 RepID=A0ABV6V1L0_9ACTN|nr:hypothetical protein [Streptacidiphilus jeojiense]